MSENLFGRRSRLVPVTAALALVFAACGSEDPSADTITTVVDGGGLRTPTPIEASGAAGANPGAGRATASAEDASADTMIAPAYIVTDYVVGPDLPALPVNTTGYVFDAATEPTADEVAELAAGLGVSGEPQRIDDAFAVSWRVGPDDGSAPSVVLWDDAMLAWNYNAGWDDREGIACASVGSEPALTPEVGATEVDPAMSSSAAPPTDDVDTAEPGQAVSPDEPVVLEPAPDDCVTPEPPENVPAADDAEALATDYLNAIGVDPASVTFDTWADEWSASVTANAMFDGAVAQSWGFTFGENGELQYAWGNAATPEPVGPYTLVDLDTAVARLTEGSYGNGGYAGSGDIAVMSDTATVTNDAVTDEPLPPADGAVEDLPVDRPEGGVEIAPGEPIPVEPDGGIGDGSEPLPEPMPMPVQEPEEITVTLVDVEADLWWVWDVHGSAWLVPAYRFIGDDGGWYTVPAVTDDFLVQTEPPVPEPVDPIPVEPDGGIGDGAEPLPAPAEFEELAKYIGLPIGDFTGEVEAAGWGPVRVVERDGEALAVTEDFRPLRVNATVVTVDGVEQVVRATTDGGELIGEITIEPTPPPTTVPNPDVPQGEVVPIVGTYAGVAFYPACGTETLEHEGVTWYTLTHAGAQPTDPEFNKLLTLISQAEREPSPVSGVNGFALRVAEPGPGDDVGTLIVWDDGVARFVSDSGDLDVWLVDDELEYTWAC